MKNRLSLLVATVAMLCIFVTMSMEGKTSRQFVIDLNKTGDGALLVYLPDHPTGRAVIVLPGGAYSYLAMSYEGTDWAPYFNDQGIATIILKYRMPKGNRWLPIADGEKALRTVRDSASAWGIDRKKIGVMGSSAGGHLATTLSTHGDVSLRPSFSILFYPVVTMGEGTHVGSRNNFLGDDRTDSTVLSEYSNERQVRAGVTPPAIIFLADNDNVVPPLQNGVAYYDAMRQCGNSCALFVYPSGGHGFGYSSSWKYHNLMLQELTAWLNQL